MTHSLRSAALAMLLVCGPSGAEESYCHWIRLTGLYIEQSPDFLARGDYLPLVGLEPGELFSLLSGSEESVRLPSKREQEIDGHWYYVPAHLIDDRTMILNVMMLDRDEDTDDDLVLPMRSHRVGLDQGFSPSGHKEIEIPEVYILDDQPTKSNEVRFRFELLRRPGLCSLDGTRGEAANSALRDENRVHDLRTRIFQYFDEPVIAGREAKLFVDDEAKDAAAAYAIAKRNLHELLGLGREVERLDGAKGFDELHHEFGRLIAILQEKRLRFSVVEKDGTQVRLVPMTAPALASNREWSRIIGDAVVEPIPNGWLLP